MANYFIAGSEIVRWDIVALGVDGPYQLTVRHSSGSIVEYFTTAAAALGRERELETLLIAARGIAHGASTAIAS
jgi:hypothetical protein